MEDAIKKKSEWIIEQYDRLSSGEPVLADDSVMFDGRSLRLDFQKTAGEEGLFLAAGGRVVVKVVGALVTVIIAPGAPPSLTLPRKGGGNGASSGRVSGDCLS